MAFYHSRVLSYRSLTKLLTLWASHGSLQPLSSRERYNISLLQIIVSLVYLHKLWYKKIPNSFLRILASPQVPEEYHILQIVWHRILQYHNPINIIRMGGLAQLRLIPLRKVVACRGHVFCRSRLGFSSFLLNRKRKKF